MVRVVLAREKEKRNRRNWPALHSRHRKISSANSAVAGVASYVYDKAENKATDQSVEFILRLKYNLQGNGEPQWMATWRSDVKDAGIDGISGVVKRIFLGVYAHKQSSGW